MPQRIDVEAVEPLVEPSAADGEPTADDGEPRADVGGAVDGAMRPAVDGDVVGVDGVAAAADDDDDEDDDEDDDDDDDATIGTEV